MDPNVAIYGSNSSAALPAGFEAFVGGMMIFALVFLAVLYIYTAICLMKIAKKTNTPNAWMAWIPIINLFLMVQIAKKPMWWVALFLLAFIPFVGGIIVLVLSIIIWMAIAKNVGKPEWWGVLAILPLINLIAMGYLAFSKSETPVVVQPETPPAPSI